MNCADAGGGNPGPDKALGDLAADPDHSVGHAVFPRAQPGPQGIRDATAVHELRPAVQHFPDRAHRGGVGVVGMHDVHGKVAESAPQPCVEPGIGRRAARQRRDGQTRATQRVRQLPLGRAGRHRLDARRTVQRAGQIMDLPLAAAQFKAEVE